MNPGQSLALVLRSPLFLEDGRVPGSFILSANFPLSNELRTVFGNAHVVSRHGRSTAELPYVIKAGSLRYEGTCSVVEADKETYEISFFVDNGELAKALEGKTLKYLDFGGDLSIVDVFCVSFSSNQLFDNTDTEPITYEIYAPNDIIIDFSNSMSIGGRAFVSPITGTIKQKITSDIYFNNAGNYGYITIECFKNGISYFFADNQTTFERHIQSLDLVAGDIITSEIKVVGGFDGSNYRLNGTLTNISIEYSTENIFTTSALNDQDNFDFVTFPILNKDFFSKFPDDAFLIDNTSLKVLYGEYFPVFNYYRDEAFPLMLNGEKNGERFFVANMFTPFVYLKSIIKKIINTAGYTIENNPFEGEFRNMVLFNSFAENYYTSDYQTLIPIKKTFNLVDHLPDISQTEFIRFISVITGYMPVVDNTTKIVRFVAVKDKHVLNEINKSKPFPGIILSNIRVSVSPEYKGISVEIKGNTQDAEIQKIKELTIKHNYKGEVQALFDLPISGNKVNDAYLVTPLREYWVWAYNSETYSLTWVLYGKDFPLVYTEGEEPYLSFSQEIYPILNSSIIDSTVAAPENRTWDIPVTSQSGTFEGFPEELSGEYALQAIYFKGIEQDFSGNNYPFATAVNDESETDPSINARSIFEKRYSSFARWLAYETKLISFEAKLTHSQLASIQMDQVYQGNGFHFLIKEINASVGINGVEKATIKAYTL